MRHPTTILLRCAAVVIPLALLTACAGTPRSGDGRPTGPRVQNVDLNSPGRPVTTDQPVALDAARNEWTSFTVQLSGLPKDWDKDAYSLRIHPPQLTADPNTSLAASNFSAYQVVSLPVDVNRAGYVRHTGLPAASDQKLPRALLPMKADDGLINLAALPSKAAVQGQPPVLWLDLHLPPETPPGDYQATCDLLKDGKVAASLPLTLTVYNFVLPDERHLLMVSQLEWERLTSLYPAEFEAVGPRLMTRGNERYREAVRVLDQLMALAQEHRAQVVVPRLQPTAKWPAGQPPLMDWRDFDTIVQPWLRGDLFADHVPLGYWPLPAVDHLDRFDDRSQEQYWTAAASHFDQMDWLPNSAIVLEQNPPATAVIAEAERRRILLEAGRLLAAHPRVRVAVPLQQTQIQLAGDGGDHRELIDPKLATRLLTAAPGLVSAVGTSLSAADAVAASATAVPAQLSSGTDSTPQRWMRTDLPGLVPYVGAGGDERDVRQWAWLAFLREAQLIVWKGALPSETGAAEAADPNELTWFYPGSWFAVREAVVPSIQLKWLRRAQQDYEYLWLAKQRGQRVNALVMARLLTKPVEIQPNQTPDPLYAMMTGTPDPAAWADGHRLLARTILLRGPGEQADPAKLHELNLQTLRWIQPQERPFLVGQRSQWLLEPASDAAPGQWVQLRLGIDIYNASDSTPDQNQLQWSSLPPGWQIRPQPTEVPPLMVYHVQRQELEAKVDLDRVEAQLHPQPLELVFTNGFTKVTSPVRVTLPVAASDRRLARLSVDGALDDWQQPDALQDGPLVQFLDRPSLHRQRLDLASAPATLYSAWADESFYLAFKLQGISDGSAAAHRARNFVDYQFRRAWGEDLCEVLVQPIYADNSTGPVLHLVCKPGGAQWVERKAGAGGTATPGSGWQPVEGSAVRYATTTENGVWRGEVAIPWKVIDDAGKGPPRLLCFNFVQHQEASGQSASWAGPIDFGRHEGLMGLLYLRDPKVPGMQ